MRSNINVHSQSLNLKAQSYDSLCARHTNASARMPDTKERVDQ